MEEIIETFASPLCIREWVNTYKTQFEQDLVVKAHQQIFYAEHIRKHSVWKLSSASL